MNNPFSQSKLIYKLYFNTLYKYLDFFEKFFPEDMLAISTFEVESKTIEAADDDIWYLEAYFALETERDFLSQRLREFAAQNNLEIIGDVRFATIEDKDWAAEYQKQLTPLYIGKFFISTSQQSDQCPPNFLPIILEASRAFGTGDHATTAGCLEIMDNLSGFDFKTIYDIGTGSGILSFAAEKIWPKAEVWACDIEETSIEVAKINQEFNNSKVIFYQNSADNLESSILQNKKFDLIVSNILANPLIELASSISSLLTHQGKLILSGFLDYQMDDVINSYQKNGLEVEQIVNKEKWITVLAKVKIN